MITTGRAVETIELAQTYFQRWNCQENSIRDWLIPLNLDTNHGYAKEPVENSELTKRQGVLKGREQRLEHLAQTSRARLTFLNDQDQQLQEQAHIYEQQWMELSLQVLPFEATGQTQERDYFPLKARQLATDWEMRQPSQISRDHHVTRSLLYVWWQLYRERGEAAFVPTQAFQSQPVIDRPHNAQEQVAHLERLCGQQALELDLLRSEVDVLKNAWHWSGDWLPSKSDTP